jgi:hypothetical protein
VKWNTVWIGIAKVIMTFVMAQEQLALTIKAAGRNVYPYFWRLSGDEPNSLCRFLSLDEEGMKGVLRQCRIYSGVNDNFKKKEFENFMSKYSIGEWTTY